MDLINDRGAIDHDGDPDVLRALHRLGLRAVQFSTQTCFNAFADSEADGSVAGMGPCLLKRSGSS